MSVATRFVRYYPFLLESDYLSLSSGFSLEEMALIDGPLQARHQLSRPLEQLGSHLRVGIGFGQLIRIAQELHLSGQQLCEFLGFLNMTGGLRCNRTTQQKLRSAYLQVVHLFLGVTYAPLFWRRAVTPHVLVHGIVRATWPVGLAAGCVGMLAIAGGLAPTVITVYLIGGCLSLLASSLFMHEVIHWYIASRAGAEPQIVQARFRLGIIHRTLDPRAELASSLLGPTTGIAICLLAALVALHIQTGMLVLASIAVGLVHLSGLLPWYGDGAAAIKTLRKHHRPQEDI